MFRNRSFILCIPLYALYTCLEILSLYYLLLSAFSNTETLGIGGGERKII